MTSRDQQRLEGVHPDLVDMIHDIFEEMEAWGAPMFVIEGLRTQARQEELYAQGRTAPGPIVTHDDGVTNKSNHQVKADGFGHAVDAAFVDGNPFAETHPWQRYGDSVKKAGLIWGGDWKMMDMPHAELPDTAI